MRVAVEVCVSTMAEAKAALALGVDRVELCAWPQCGGITPGYGLLVAAMRQRTPARVLVRARPGGFVHSAEETTAMLDEVTLCRDMGFQHLVVGALTADHLVDAAYLRAVRQRHPDAVLTFHRAIDHCPDPLRALDTCVELGVQRILTSGGSPLALDGVPAIARMLRHAPPGLAIAVAGGVAPGNVVGIVERTGAREVHFAAFTTEAATSVAMSTTSPQADRALLPDLPKIEGVLNALSNAGLR